MMDASPLRATPLDAFRESHWEAYNRVVNGYCEALSAVWSEMGVHASEVHTELNSVETRIEHVWQTALEGAKGRKEALQQRILETRTEIQSIQTQLGETIDEMDTTPSMGMTLNAQLEKMTLYREQCLEMKKQRIAEFQDLFEKLRVIQSQFGQDPLQPIDYENPQCKITRGDLDYLKCELDSYSAERTRRLMRLESLWKPMKSLCSELGEDPTDIAKSVHPGLEFAEQSISGMGLPFSSDRLPPLSEASFAAFEEKLTSLKTERSSRESLLLHTKEMLMSLWNALQTASDDLDRSILTRLMEGPARLHHKTFDKIREEIHRQETAKARILRDLVEQKMDEIKTVCEGGHLPLPPEMQQIVNSTSTEDGSTGVNCADALAQLTRLQTQMTVMAEKRRGILAMITDLQSARVEVDWLTSYERDGDRYKGRDCNKKLQRAIKAGKVKEKLPSLVGKLNGLILEWEQSEHQPFIFDGVDYRKEVLERYELSMAPSVKGGRGGRRTPQARKSAIPDFASPCQSARGASKHRLTPHSNSKSVCLGEGGSKIARPKSSMEESAYKHLFKNAQTDYHPLQETLNALCGAGTTGVRSKPNGRSPAKSGIPATPKKQSPNAMVISQSSASTVSKASRSSEDEEMEDVVQTPPRQTQMSLPPPKLNLSALARDINTSHSTSYSKPAHRRPTL